MKQHLHGCIVILIVILVLVGAAVFSRAAEESQPVKARPTSSSPSSSTAAAAPFAGSASCRQCHESFYQLWAPSHHGLAMQPYTFQFAQANLTAPAGPIRIGPYEYLACLGRDEGWVLERGPLSADAPAAAADPKPEAGSPAPAGAGAKRLPIVHVLGGKNVYYFLTSLDRGRLQTLPVAYDVHRKTWFDTAASGVRHFPGGRPDAPIHWTDPMYTFNTSCHSCHVSQLSTNYDLASDSYHTTWAEPGINCESCHGPAQEHVRLCQEHQTSNLKLQTPADLKIIRTKTFTPEQTNSMCGSCHAKMSLVSASFQPGERFFDHFDLTALEHPDFYPDGRDLGENYTMTTWRMSPCAQSGQGSPTRTDALGSPKLDCAHCHTSSGRYRFAGAEQPNAACLPCHQDKVQNVAAHTHHPAGGTSPGSPAPSAAQGDATRCIACHMPMTEFARMRRSDHSMRPPTPAATLRFKSPNACNLCHTDRDAAWADQQVRQWHPDDYQKPVLERAALVDAARRGDWSRLNDILAYLGSPDRDEVFAASLLRLLHSCDSPAKWPVVLKALREDPSPLVRGSAAQALEGYLTAESLSALAKATTDEYRLVRVRAASTLAGVPAEHLPAGYRDAVQRATAELLDGLRARPDDYAAHYNLGNYCLQQGNQDQALAAFQTAIRLRSDFVPPYVNVAFVYNAKGDNAKAEASFRQALALDPNNPVVHLNLAMLLAEMNRLPDAEQAFRKVLALDPNAAIAAYNLGVLLAADRPYESLRWCQKAHDLQPRDGKYAYTYAFFLNQRRETDKAIEVLKDLIRRHVPYADAYALLASIHLDRGRPDEAAAVYRAACANPGLTPDEREAFQALLSRLEQGY